MSCTEITCELKSITPEVKNFKPQKKKFKAGESVEITCSEKAWVFTKETSKTFMCQDNGEWDHEPVCQEITCEYPHDQHVSRSSISGESKLGEKQSYSCEEGYRETAEKATCTRDGWTPNPLCTGMFCCEILISF
ncbi:Complement factor H [Labeo rohita]|uniref:Complement factor H n=1 Tax=Labeo rohita TaxID=84645 RepID=A0ABQ8L387_LABRO|nr:Complement factor H [Labeo rohita]